MINPGTLYKSKEQQHLGVVLEIKTVLIEGKLFYMITSLTEKGLVLDKLWTIDPNDERLSYGFTWELIC